MFRLREILSLLCLSIPAVAGSLPADRETVPRAELAALATAPDEFPATSGYTQRVEYIDFNSYGQEDPLQVLYAAGYRPLPTTSGRTPSAAWPVPWTTCS